MPPFILSTRFTLLADHESDWIGKMHIGNPLPVICSLSGLFSHRVSALKVQFPGLKLPKNSEIHRANIVLIFEDPYNPYVEFYFPHDD